MTNLKIETALKDWREDRDEDAPVSIEVKQDRVDLTFSDGRALWIEYEGGVIAVHGYLPQEEAPFNLKLGEDFAAFETQVPSERPGGYQHQIACPAKPSLEGPFRPKARRPGRAG